MPPTPPLRPASAPSRLRLVFSTVPLLAVSVLSACGGGSDGADASADAMPGDAARDGAPHDATSEAGPDGGNPREGGVDGGGPSLRDRIAARVAPLVDPRRASNDFEKTVGMVVTVVSADDAFVMGFGARREGGTEPPDETTPYQLGSVTKVLTGLLLAEAEERSAAAADDLVEDLWPAVAGANGTAGVTLQHLATHHSGLPYMPDNLPMTDPLAPAAGYTTDALRDFLFGLPRPVTPGGSYVYSNTGIGLLGVALGEREEAASYHDLLSARLLVPAGIEDGLWGQLAAVPAAAASRAATGYVRTRSGWREGRFVSMGALAPAGEAVATGGALRTLLLALTGRGAPALQPAIERALTPRADAEPPARIGYGIEVHPVDDGRGPSFEKAGSTRGGFTTYLAFRRDPPVGVVVTVDAQPFRATRGVARDVLRLLSEDAVD